MYKLVTSCTSVQHSGYNRFMESPDLSIPLRQVINVVALVQALIFAAILAARPLNSSIAAWFLVALLSMIAAMKADQLYQLLGGLHHYPEYGFLLAPLQALITPLLYFYVAAKTSSEFSLKRQHLWHLTPLAITAIYLFVFYYRLDVSDKAALMASNGLSAPLHRLVMPLVGDIIQLGYVIAAYQRLERYGVSLKNWFSQVEDRDLRWLKRLLVLWGGVFVFHTIWTLSAGFFGALPFARAVLDVLNFIHLAMVNAIFVMGLTASASPQKPLPRTAAPSPKYASSSLSPAERKLLFEKTAEAMQNEALYLNPDLTLRSLADHLAATPREVSEAINGEGEQSFFEFVNSARITHAQSLLINFPDKRILEIAFESGFNSKTAFNEAFRKLSGMPPSAFRKSGQAAATLPKTVKTPT